MIFDDILNKSMIYDCSRYYKSRRLWNYYATTTCGQEKHWLRPLWCDMSDVVQIVFWLRPKVHTNDLQSVVLLVGLLFLEDSIIQLCCRLLGVVFVVIRYSIEHSMTCFRYVQCGVNRSPFSRKFLFQPSPCRSPKIVYCRLEVLTMV